MDINCTSENFWVGMTELVEKTGKNVFSKFTKQNNLVEIAYSACVFVIY